MRSRNRNRKIQVTDHRLAATRVRYQPPGLRIPGPDRRGCLKAPSHLLCGCADPSGRHRPSLRTPMLDEQAVAIAIESLGDLHTAYLAAGRARDLVDELDAFGNGRESQQATAALYEVILSQHASWQANDQRTDLLIHPRVGKR